MKTFILSLLTLAIIVKADIVIYPLNPPVSGKCSHGSGCPGGFCGDVTYIYTNGGAWGYGVDTNATTWTATDTNRSNTKVQLFGIFGDPNCNQTVVSPTASPPISPQYRFTVYFTNSTPTTTNYPLVLHGFIRQ